MCAAAPGCAVLFPLTDFMCASATAVTIFSIAKLTPTAESGTEAVGGMKLAMRLSYCPPSAMVSKAFCVVDSVRPLPKLLLLLKLPEK